MTPADWAILIAYCVLLIAVAAWFRRRAAGGVESYFVADRNLPWWVIGFADTAAYTGGGQGFVMVFFLDGMAGLWLMGWVTWVIWMPLVAVLWARMWRRLGVVTTGQFIECRYGGRWARIYRNVYAVYACLAWGLTVLAYVAAWTAATLAPILGWTEPQVLAAFGAVTVAYTLVSGLFAVAYNDVLQFCLLMAGNTLFGGLLLAKVGGFAAAWEKIAVLRGGEFLQPFPIGGKLTGISLVALTLQGLFFAGSPFAGEGFTAQRYMAARNELHAVVGQMFNAVLALVVRLIPIFLIGLAAVALYPADSVAVPAQLWGQLVKRYAPPGLFGLLLVGGLAGYMAALSSIGNWAAGYLVNDLYRLSIRPRASDREYVLVSRIASGLLLVAALAWGAMIDPAHLDRWVLFINSALVVFPLPLAWLKWFWWRTNVFGDMAGVLGAFPAGYIVWFGSDAVLPGGFRGWWRGLTGLSLDGLVPAFGDLNRYPFWMGFGLLFALGWLVIISVTLLTRPEPLDVLDRFYRKVRPIGFWRPVEAGLTEHERAELRAEAWRDIRACAAGVAVYFALVVSFFSLVAGRGRLAIGAGCVCAAATYFFVRPALRARSNVSQTETERHPGMQGQ